jgi:uncharacterized protein YbaR (Trm112 family)/SAM-dependent methyltransferase
MDTWLLDVVACPLDGGRLAVTRGGKSAAGGLDVGVLACDRCKQQYPVVGGVPIVVSLPAEWLSAYHDAVLAALSEAGRASRAAVELVNQYAAAAPHVEPRRFSDVWVEHEPEVIPHADEAVTIVDHGSPAKAFANFVERARGSGPRETLLEMLENHNFGTVVEVGSGAGTFARPIRKRAKRYLVCDLSMRAVLRSLEAARRTRGSLIGGAVVDANRMRLRSGSVQTLVAGQLVDLLDQPRSFFESVAIALADKGRFAVITPAPELGNPEGTERELHEAIEAVGLTIEAARDGIPWIREHSSRHFEVYFALAIVASK